MDTNMMWREFYELEMNFYRSLQHTKPLKTIDDFKAQYTEYENEDGNFIYIHPDYVREIYQVSDIEFYKLQAQWKVVYQCWRYTMESCGFFPKKLPARFPQFIDNVDHISISKSKAYESRELDGKGDISLCRYIFSDMESAQKDSLALESIGIKSNIEYTPRERKSVTSAIGSMITPNIWLKVDQAEIINYFSHVDKVRMRRCSGHQYRATIKQNGNSVGKRFSLGLMICRGNNYKDITISSPKPTNTRSHKTELIKDKLTFGVNLLGQFANFYDETA